MFRGFCTKTTGSHKALHEHNSDAESGRELFKGLEDSASLALCNEKKLFGWECRFFVRDIVSEGL